MNKYHGKPCHNCEVLGFEFCKCNKPAKRGRKPIPEHQKRLKHAIYFAPGTKELAETILADNKEFFEVEFDTKKLGWGHVVDIAIKRLAENGLDHSQ